MDSTTGHPSTSLDPSLPLLKPTPSPH
uniref:Uncharacterized protein n=1 Tax=Arundo donax TaxID=35708 RepID=A0A0A9G4N4_ARUDO